jgi:hypothetical protein
MRDPLYKDDFESFLEKQVDRHRMYPSDRVWRTIQDTLHEKGRWPALTFIFLFIIALLVVGTLLVKPEDHLNFIQKTPYLVAGPAIQSPAADSIVPTLTESLATGTATEKTIAYANERMLLHILNDSIISAGIADSMNRLTILLPAAALPVVPPANLLPEQFTGSSWTALPGGAPVLNSPVLPSEDRMAIAGKHPPLAAVTLPAPAAASKQATTLPEHLMPEIIIPDRMTSRWDFHFYAAPSASYRRLLEEKTTKGMAQFLSTPVAPNYLVDVNKVVRHTPALGFEVGFAIGYRLNKQFSVRAGLQYNVRQYNIEASGYSYEATSIALNGQDTLNTYTPYRNIKGDYPVTLHNKYHEFSLPVGINWTGWKHKKLAWGVSATVQPTYTFNKQPFIISSDFKNYANGATLTRRWNVNTSFETYLSYTVGTVQWQIGPQFRYQQLSSFKQQYPIKEYLLDYGIKIGFTTPL